jgi:REP element-mobilizing transposase RayT
MVALFGHCPAMARKLRLEYPGAIYHVMNRGDRREAIFHDDADREWFLGTLGQACQKTGWQVLAYCLLSNHFHLVVETPQGNLVAGMKWLLGTYTSRFNRRHKLVGHLFSGRYKALIVDGSSRGYLRTVGEYVHLNPARAKLLRPEEPLRTYRWSSYPAYLKGPGQRPQWLRVERVLGEMGIPKDSLGGRRQFERLMEERRQRDEPGAYRRIRRGWCLGEEGFRKELLAQVEERRGASHYGEELQEGAREKAERLVREGLEASGWTEEELAARKKSDRTKLRLAVKLRSETPMTLKWIAGRLQMGTGTSLSNLLSAQRRRKR